MNCEWKHKIQALHDGALPAAERAGVEAHAAACEPCGRELKLLRRLGKFLRAGNVNAIDELAMARLRKRLGAERISLRVLLLAKRLTAAAALVMVVCGGALYLKRAPGQAQANYAAAPSWVERVAVAENGDISSALESDPLTMAVYGERDTSRE